MGKPAKLRAGMWVTIESTTGWATSSPKKKVVSGKTYRDDEGFLRVEDVPIHQDEKGYFPKGVILLSTGRPKS